MAHALYITGTRSVRVWGWITVGGSRIAVVATRVTGYRFVIRVWTNGYSSRSTDRIQLRSHSVEPSRNIPEAELTILHVLDSSGLSHGGVEGGAAEAGVSARIAIEVGQPSDVIVEYAEEEGIDHIVMGSHGRSGLSKIVVGSVAESVIRDSQASVTIAR